MSLHWFLMPALQIPALGHVEEHQQKEKINPALESQHHLFTATQATGSIDLRPLFIATLFLQRGGPSAQGTGFTSMENSARIFLSSSLLGRVSKTSNRLPGLTQACSRGMSVLFQVTVASSRHSSCYWTQICKTSQLFFPPNSGKSKHSARNWLGGGGLSHAKTF